ncbi:MAG: DUF1592 domain-containing protein, partial [Pirellulaceae bacterium]|nr:DUF1592 domain-containing protein [Pirellulaceae bacterium]
MLCLASEEARSEDFRSALAPFFEKYCNDCHADGAAEGGFRLEAVGPDLSDEASFATWERVFDRVRTGEMPPPDASAVSDADRSNFIKRLGSPLHQTHAKSKGTVYRRLNRREYQNTLNDIFGSNLDLESMLPEDGRSHEFDNVGQSLSISMVHLQQYISAIDLVMESAIATSVDKPIVTVKHANYADTDEGKKHIGTAWKKLDDGAVVFFRELGYPSGMLRTANTNQPGWYKIRVTGYAYQSDKPITFAIGATTFQRGAERPTFAYQSMPPGDPTTVEIDAWIDSRYMVEITPWGIADETNAIRENGIDGYQGPGLAILNVDLEGPLLEQFPSRGHRLLFDGVKRIEIEPSNPSQKSKSWYVPKFEVQSSDPVSDATTILKRVATVAHRRPVSPDQTKRYVELFQSQIEQGETFEQALRSAVAAIFCSPDFLYLQEPSGWLDDYALASRLSYFLTRTTPDAQLLAAAESGRLATDPEELLNHTRRLLNDPRHERFITDFTNAWLNLRDIEFTSPDKNLYPEYDSFLLYSMLSETRGYVASLIRDNASVRHLVKSDFAMLNNRLAQHYGIDNVTGPEIKRTPLPKDSVRGGLLSQASILKVSANGTNTSPVMRGVWVLERIVGQTPPPPPSGVAGLEPDIRGASTLRELLAKHRDSESCRSCHEMIDPPGFALESFNPIGGWRDRFRSLGEGEKVNLMINGRKVRYRIGPEVDASGKMQDGKSFDGFVEFRDLLAADEDQLTRTLA